METTFIYGLVDPRDNQIKYVGKSNNPSARLHGHKKEREVNKDKQAWIKELDSLGLEPGLKILDTPTLDQWQAAEKKWIQYYSGVYQLLNKTPGGGSRRERKQGHTAQSSMTFRLDDYKDLLKQLADRESRSMSAELRHLLDRRAIELGLEPANPLLKGELLTE